MYLQVDKQVVDIILEIKKFHQYINGRYFTSTTYNKAVSLILDAPTAFPKLAAAKFVGWSTML